MPYITPIRREALMPKVRSFLGTQRINSEGELNYVLTLVVEEYRREHGDSYRTFNDIVGALDNAKDEFRRQVQHPYEDIKRATNGPVHAPVLQEV